MSKKYNIIKNIRKNLREVDVVYKKIGKFLRDLVDNFTCLLFIPG